MEQVQGQRQWVQVAHHRQPGGDAGQGQDQRAFAGDAAAQAETRAATAWGLDQLLHLLHPFMPFVTEELWEQLAAPE